MADGKGLYQVIANDITVGGTIGTFDAINTRNANLTMREGTRAVVGLTFVGVSAAQTTATAVLARLRVNSSDLGVVEEDFAVGEAHGGGIATQSSAWFSPAEWISVEWDAKPGNIINLLFSQAGIEPADTWAVQAGVAHVAGVMPSKEWLLLAQMGGTMAHQGGAAADGGSTTTARTSLGSASIGGRFTQLVSWRGLQAQDGVPASGESGVAFCDITSGIGDFTPQEWPMSAVGPALAGTLVGGGVAGFQPKLPFYMTKDANSRTVEPFVTGLDTLAAANAYSYGIGLRY